MGGFYNFFFLSFHTFWVCTFKKKKKNLNSPVACVLFHQSAPIIIRISETMFVLIITLI